jgi:hypothetical protein
MSWGDATVFVQEKLSEADIETSEDEEESLADLKDLEVATEGAVTGTEQHLEMLSKSSDFENIDESSPSKISNASDSRSISDDFEDVVESASQESKCSDEDDQKLLSDWIDVLNEK